MLSKPDASYLKPLRASLSAALDEGSAALEGPAVPEHVEGVLASMGNEDGFLTELRGRAGELTPPPIQPGDVMEMTVAGMGTTRDRVIACLELPLAVHARRGPPIGERVSSRSPA